MERKGIIMSLTSEDIRERHLEDLLQMVRDLRGSIEELTQDIDSMYDDMPGEDKGTEFGDDLLDVMYYLGKAHTSANASAGGIKKEVGK